MARKSILCALGLVLTTGIPLGYSQSTKSEGVLQLSPFEVTADSEVGYMATQTLSGSRLRTELGNVAASIDVLTAEFLRDVGATNMYDALDFVGNVTTAAVNGGVLGNQENQVWFSNPYTARGFNATAVYTDFFNMGRIPLDFYNTSNFTVARGPNSILYGIGSPGGLVNSARKRPQFGKDFTEVQFRTDNYGSFRATLDANKEIIKNKLGVRVALLHDDRKEFLKPAEIERHGVYGAVTYRPSKKTSLTVTGEKGSEYRTFQYSMMAFDGISRWLQAGKPVYAGTGTAPLTGNNSMNTNFGSGLDREAKEGLVIYGQPNIPILDWVNMARTERLEINNHPDIGAIRNTSFTEDTAVWDYANVQLPGNSRQRSLKWTDISVFLTQELFVPDLQLELAFNRSKTDSVTANTFGMFFLQMDANRKLPNGSPNPNFGIPYVESERTEVPVETNTLQTARATLSYNLDLKDKKIFGLGLGRYTFMGMYEENRTNSLFAQFRRAYIPTTLPGFPAGANNYNNASNRVRTRTYVQTSLTPAGANVEPYYKVDFSPIDRDGVQDAWYPVSSPRDILDKRQSSVAAVQGFFWKAKEGYERVLLTYGVRSDKQSSQRKVYPVASGVFPGAFWRGDPFSQSKDTLYNGPLNYGTVGAATVTKAPTKTYSAILKPTKNISLFYNYSDVQIAISSLNTDIYNRFLPNTIGETNDFGFRVSLYDGKVAASFSKFETTANGQLDDQFIRTTITPTLEDIWEVVDPTSRIHKGFNERYSTLRDDASKGYEFTLIANLARGWSTRLAVSSANTIVKSRLPIVNQYIAEFSPLWEAQRAKALVSPDTTVGYNTVGDALTQLRSDIADFMALVGSAPQAQRQYKVSFNTNYNFRDRVLKGFSLGGGVRWQSKDVIGYGYNVASLTKPEVVIDSSKPFYGESLLDVSASLGYSFEVKRIPVRLQLNVSNLLDQSGTFARAAIDDLKGNRYETLQQVRQPRSFVFTTTFEF